ncbi:MAG: restriction endonuclease subunit S [Alphaproteobacteria bacterium]|nr:restriction endonuclease subunit S [Alphaproteobacteria bacterium]
MAKLEEYCLNITDGEHGSVIDDNNGKYYLLSNKNMIDGEIVITSNDRKISEENFHKINKRTKLSKDDVLISTVGTIGKVAIVEGDVNYDFQRSVGIIKCNTNVLLPKFLYYYLSSPYIQNKLINTAKGAIQKCIFINDLKNLEVSIPSIPLQEKVSKVLAFIDNKIKLNNKINTELENMAKTLYDYWFVQFDFPDENKRPYKSVKNWFSSIYNKLSGQHTALYQIGGAV